MEICEAEKPCMWADPEYVPVFYMCSKLMKVLSHHSDRHLDRHGTIRIPECPVRICGRIVVGLGSCGEPNTQHARTTVLSFLIDAVP